MSILDTIRVQPCRAEHILFTVLFITGLVSPGICKKTQWPGPGRRVNLILNSRLASGKGVYGQKIRRKQSTSRVTLMPHRFVM